MLLVSLLFPSVAVHFLSGIRIMSVISSSWRSDWMSCERELVFLEGVAAGGGSPASMDVMGGMEHSDSDSMMMKGPVVEVCSVFNY